MDEMSSQSHKAIAPFGEDSAFRALAILLMFICLVILGIAVGLCSHQYITQVAPKMMETVTQQAPMTPPAGDPGMMDPGMDPGKMVHFPPVFPLYPKWICFVYTVAILIVVYTIIVFYRRIELILIRCRIVFEMKLPFLWLWRIYCVISRIVIWIAYVVVIVDLIWLIRVFIFCFRVPIIW